jgi:hypothetical protein
VIARRTVCGEHPCPRRSTSDAGRRRSARRVAGRSCRRQGPFPAGGGPGLCPPTWPGGPDGRRVAGGGSTTAAGCWPTTPADQLAAWLCTRLGAFRTPAVPWTSSGVDERPRPLTAAGPHGVTGRGGDRRPKGRRSTVARPCGSVPTRRWCPTGRRSGRPRRAPGMAPRRGIGVPGRAARCGQGRRTCHGRGRQGHRLDVSLLSQITPATRQASAARRWRHRPPGSRGRPGSSWVPARPACGPTRLRLTCPR